MIIFNGPPRSGKNTMLSLLMDAIEVGICPNNVIPFSYKWVLCEGVAERYGMSPREVWDLNDNTHTKDLADERFGGKSVRQTLIYESEEVIKKEYGEDGVAIKTFENLKAKYGERLLTSTLVTPDGGFDNEATAFQKFFWVVREDIFIVRMLREGYDYSGDSRNYIPNPDLIIENDRGPKDLRKYLHPLIQFIKAPDYKARMESINERLDSLELFKARNLSQSLDWYDGTLP